MPEFHSVDGINKPTQNRSTFAQESIRHSMPPPKKPRRALKFTLVIIILIIVGLGGLVLVRAGTIGSKIFVGQDTSLYDKLADLVRSTTGGTRLLGESSGQVNVLLLGIGGEGHDGPYLTDTIIIAQIRPDDKQAALISIPRDLLVDFNKSRQGRINEVFANTYGTTKDYDEAGRAIRQTVESLSGLTIPYFAVVDFEGFAQAVDLVGGVDLTVDRTFTDRSFPNSKYGYLPALTFTEGTQHMNGTRALQFARSRHADGPEGSDFARGLRQQKVINALKDKVAVLDLIGDPQKINDLAEVVGDHFHTNLSPGEIFRLYNITKDFNQDNMVSLSLDTSTGLECDGRIEATGAYVIMPCPGKTSADIKNFFRTSFTTGRLLEERAVIWMANSTKSASVYTQAEKKLQGAGFTVYKITYTGQPLEQSAVYQVNSKPASLEFIKNTLGTVETSIAPPGVKVDAQKVDLIIVLGNNNSN